MQDAFLLGTNFAASGQSAAVENDPFVRSLLSVYAGANVAFGGGTVTVQMSPDGGTTWLPTAHTFTSASANKLVNHYEVFGPEFRLSLAGATTPNLDLDMVLRGAQAGREKTFKFAIDGVTDPFLLEPGEKSFGWVYAGTWGAGTLKLEYSIDGGTTWKTEASVTADGFGVVNVGHVMAAGRNGVKPVHKLFRLTLTGATNPALRVQFYF